MDEELKSVLDEMMNKINDIHKMARETRVRMYEYIEESKQ